jgi:hypothetical protein
MTEKKSQHNIFSLFHRKQKIIFIFFPQHNHLFITLYILFEYCIYIRIFCIYAKRKQIIEKHVFFQTGTIRSEVSSLLSVFSRLFYADAHVGGMRRKTKTVGGVNRPATILAIQGVAIT